MVSRLILNLRNAALRPRYVVSCANGSQSACLADFSRTLTKGDDNHLDGKLVPAPSLAKGYGSSVSVKAVDDAGAGSGTCRGRGIFSSAVIGNLGEPVACWGSGDFDTDDERDRERPRKQSLHGKEKRNEKDVEADMQEVPLRIDTDGIMLRERAPVGTEKRKTGHHVHRITSHNRDYSHSSQTQSRILQRDRTRGGASISSTSTSPTATNRLRGIIVEVTRDVRIEPSLGSARSDATGPTRGLDYLSDDEPALSTSLRSNAPSLRSPRSDRNLELAMDENSRREGTQTPSRSRGRTRASSRAGLAELGLGASGGGGGGRATGDPAWVPPETWMLEEGVQMEELGRAK